MKRKRDTLGRRIFIMFFACPMIFLFLCQSLFTQESLSILKGPYLQNVTSNSIVIMWETNIQGTGSVIFRDMKGNTQIVTESKPKTIHEVLLSNLPSGLRFSYQVVTKTESGAVKSQEYSFRTVPLKLEPWSFVVYGDTRSNPSIHSKVIDQILKEGEHKPAFLLHTGDLINNGSVYECWDGDFFKPGKELFAVTPLWPCLGNHEQNSEWYFKFFSLPNNERWYSFNYLNAHFIALDSYSDFKPKSEQYIWLGNDLKSCKSDWIFVFFHVPPYSVGRHNAVDEKGVPVEAEVKNSRLYLDPLFQKYKVDMVFNGHNHFYERSLKEKVYYIVSGGGGATFHDKECINQYNQVFKRTYHYVVCDINGLNLKMYVKDIDGNIIDTLELTKSKMSTMPH